MNYEDAFKNYENGTATEEEKAFVKAELAKAKSLGNMLEAEVVEEPSPIAEAEVTEIKKAKKQFKIKHILFALGALALVVIMVGAILGGVFGSAAVSAKEQIAVSKNQAIEVGKIGLLDWLNDMRNDSNGQLGLPGGTYTYTLDEIRYDGLDQDFVYELPLGDSHYVYKIEFEVRHEDYIVHVDSRDGKVIRIKFGD